MLEMNGRVMVIEDDDSLREAIGRIATSWGADVVVAATVAEAVELLLKSPSPEVILIDVRLSDDSAFRVLDVAVRLSPAPVIVAMSGKASPDEAFQLAQRGVRRYLAKPFSRDDLVAAVEAARSGVPDIEPVISACVGRLPMRQLQHEIRRVMVREALARTDGSRSGAARLLRVTRQAVQQMLRGEDRSGPIPSAPKRPRG